MNGYPYVKDCSLHRICVNQTDHLVVDGQPQPLINAIPRTSSRRPDGTFPERRRCWTRRLGAICLAVVIVSPTVVRAQGTPPRLPNEAELTAARSLIDRGMIAVVEPSVGTARANLMLLAPARASAERAFQVVAQPELYPEFMGALDEVDVTSRRGGTLVYSWQWRMGGAPWQGVSAMAFAPPRDISVRIMRSDLGTGQFRWHFYPAGESSSLIAESLTLDLSGGHRIIQWLVGRGAAMSESVSLTLGIVLLEGSRRRAEALGGAQASVGATATPPSGLTGDEVNALVPLLDRGAVVLLESEPDGSFRQAVVVEAIDAPRERVLDLLHHPERWTAAVPVLSALEITSRQGSTMDARVAMNLSLFEVEGTVRITTDAEGVELRGTAGGLSRLRLRFRLSTLPDGRTVLQVTGRSQASQAAFFLRQLVRSEPNFEHGLGSAAQLLFVRGLAAEAVRPNPAPAR